MPNKCNASLTENVDRASSIGLTKGYTTKMAREGGNIGFGIGRSDTPHGTGHELDHLCEQ
jgi:hypothetical protein